MIRLTYLTLFPELIEGYYNEGLLARALQNKLLEKQTIQLREFSKNKYKSIDGKSYGGGDGMVFSPAPVFEAISSAKSGFVPNQKNKIILLSPQGKRCDQSLLEELSNQDHIVFVCGRYAGFDQRISAFCDLELSIGDYVLSGGELPALVVSEGLMRHKKGFLGNADSVVKDSFADENILEAPQFTEPAQFMNQNVPEVLLSGHHQKIADWKQNMAILMTLKKRPDLIANVVSKKIPKAIKAFYQNLTATEKSVLGVENLEQKIEDLIK